MATQAQVQVLALSRRKSLKMVLSRSWWRSLASLHRLQLLAAGLSRAAGGGRYARRFRERFKLTKRI